MWLRSLFFAVLMGGLAAPVVAQDCDKSRPATAPMSQFKVGPDGAITDTKSKHTWLRCPAGMSWDGSTCTGQSHTYTWNDALEVVSEFNAKKVGGRSNWRLPKVEELNTIVEKQCFKPAINLEAFPFSPESGFWTDSSLDGAQPRVWIVHFLHGQQYIANKKQDWRIRLIAD